MILGNRKIAKFLTEIADLLQQQEANGFRVRAYRSAAAEILDSEIDMLSKAKNEGVKALVELPAIGEHIARLIVEIAHTGNCSYLARLRGELSMEHLLDKTPGIGKILAKRVVQQLGVESPEDLELALQDGRLKKIPGFGRARVYLVQLLLHRLFHPFTKLSPEGKRPGIELLLNLDRKYREMARENKLPKIAPRRLNPNKEKWLPIYHHEESGWMFTVLFSNTARAHQLGKQKDWVIIYFEKAGEEGQVTVVTETQGPFRGRRMVRGMENACRNYYELPLLLESAAEG